MAGHSYLCDVFQILLSSATKVVQHPSLLLAAASITSGEEGIPDSTLCSLLAVPMVRTSRDTSNKGDLVRRAAVEKQGYPEYEYKHHILPLVADKTPRW